MKKILILLICSLSFTAFAQGEANNWYFGNNAGITFNTNPPSALTDGQLSTSEGCSSISDANGNLLMYTDGRTIWDRNHNIMPNADYFNGTGLNGDPSSTSSGLIVPHPTDPNLYFVFTIDEPHHENANAYPNRGPANSNGNSIPVYTDTNIGVPDADDGFNNGLNYSIVDMTLNGGLGDVQTSEKNKELITYDPTDSEEVKYKASEKITAIRGRDCNSVWLITHFRDKFYAFIIDDDGLDESPVISTVPPLLETTNYRRAALGYLKASPKGDKLLVAHNTTTFDPEAGNSDDGNGNVYAYDFDNLDGTVTNPVELISDVNAYGVEFSQDGTKAYATIRDPLPRIYQWDLESTDIFNSIILIAEISQTTALQLGPDGKIYHSILNSSSLGVINSPNELGSAANYTQSGIFLNGRIATFGLPPFIQSLFSERIPLIQSSNDEIIEQVAVCDTYTYELSYTVDSSITNPTYTWFKDDVLLPGENSNTLVIDQDPNAIYPIEENYKLEVDLGNGDCPLIGIAKVTFNQSPAYTDDALLSCQENNMDAVYNLSEIESRLAEQAGIDEGEIDLQLYRNSSDANSGINSIPITPNFINDENLDALVVKISTFGVCDDEVIFDLIAQPLPSINTAEETSIYCLENFPETLRLSALEQGDDASLYEYFWSTGETTPEININSAGQYIVDVNLKGFDCFLSKSFTIIESNIAEFDYEVESSGNTNIIEIIIANSSLGDYEFAIDEPINFQESNVFEDLSPGIYQVFVRDRLGCGLAEKTVGILGIMDFFTPNGDGINDVWQISGLLDDDQEQINLQVFDRYGKLIAAFTNKDRGWDGTYNGKNMPIDDYWYRIQFSDGTLETGNFTLKR